MLLRRVMLSAMLCLLATLPALAADEVVLTPRPGVTESVFLTIVPGATRNVILFTGGQGGYRNAGNNFVLRIQGQLTQAGFNIAAPEVPSDFPGGMSFNFRIGPDHAIDIAAIIDLMKQRADLPVWLVSTSNGTLSAASIAARIGPPRVAGIVLTSSVWQRLPGFVKLDQIQVPTLLIHNRDDGCRESPYDKAEAGLAALAHAPARELITVSGGISRSDACQAMSPHGYLGIETQVVPPMVAWIKSH